MIPPKKCPCIVITSILCGWRGRVCLFFEHFVPSIEILLMTRCYSFHLYPLLLLLLSTSLLLPLCITSSRTLLISIWTHFCLPHPSWSPPPSSPLPYCWGAYEHTSFSFLCRLLPLSLPAASAQPAGNFHTRLIEFKPPPPFFSLYCSLFLQREWDETTKSHHHTHLYAYKWTLTIETHSMQKLRLRWH